MVDPSQSDAFSWYKMARHEYMCGFNVHFVHLTLVSHTNVQLRLRPTQWWAWEIVGMPATWRTMMTYRVIARFWLVCFVCSLQHMACGSHLPSSLATGWNHVSRGIKQANASRNARKCNHVCPCFPMFPQICRYFLIPYILRIQKFPPN